MRATKVIVICFIFSIGSAAEYSFRKYNGTIPSDAIPGGTDENGKNTYIAQIEIGTDIVSATLYPEDPMVYAAYHQKVYSTDKGIKILCGSPIKNFVWNTTVPENCELIRGSYTNPYDNYYIGKCRIYGRYFGGRFSKVTRTLQVPIREFPDVLTRIQYFTKLMYCQN